MDKRELSSIKHNLFDMLRNAGKHDNDNYSSLIEALDVLNFKDFTLDSYSTQLVGIINEMYDLDDLAFEPGMLDHYLNKLSR